MKINNSNTLFLDINTLSYVPLGGCAHNLETLFICHTPQVCFLPDWLLASWCVWKLLSLAGWLSLLQAHSVPPTELLHSAARCLGSELLSWECSRKVCKSWQVCLVHELWGTLLHRLSEREKVLTAPAACRSSSVSLVNRVELACFISLCKMQI